MRQPARTWSRGARKLRKLRRWKTLPEQTEKN
jgi:hypothetical protein